MAHRFCDNLLLNDEINVFGNGIGVSMIALSGIYLASSFLLIYFVKVQEYYAKRTDSKAVRIQIFPFYNYILWANAIVNVYVGLIGLYYTFQPFSNSGDRISAWAFAIMWGLQHAVVEGVPFMLMQKGLGTHAIKQSAYQSIAWGVYTMFNTLAIYKTKELGSFLFSLTWQTILLIGYFCLWALPQKKLFRRPAVINYSLFWFLFRSLSIIATVLFFIKTTHSEGNCIYVIGTLFPYAILEPFVIYYTLLQDSKWWQGMEIMQGRRVQSAEEIRSPMAGLDLSINSAQSLAASMDNMSVGTGKGSIPVRLLNFAYITLDKTRQLGSGSFSKVYLGSYRGQRCAIKLIFTLDLTQDVIRRVAAEAQILSMIKHKNIVNILGVSVLPPSVCILLELCVFGSLADVIKASGPVNGFNANDHNTQLTGGGIVSGLTVCWADRLYLAIGCARGLHALHTYSSELCHRDIKSFNFLVDEHLNAKISDLELGITEEVVKPALTINTLRQKTNKLFGKKVSGFSVNSGSQSDSEQVSELGIGEGVLRADDFLANWSAPEVIKDGCHVQASDIYSFSLVLWEILTGLVPYSEIKKQDDIRYKVLSGERPLIPDCVFETESERKYYEHYTALITRGWQHEPNLRPSITEMLGELECMWRSCCGGILVDTDVMPEIAEIFDDQQNRQQSRFSVWSSMTPASHFAPATGGHYNVSEPMAKKIAEMMYADKEAFSVMDNHEGAWILVTADKPHVVLRCNGAFTSLSGLQLTDIIGLPFRETPMFGHNTEQLTADEFALNMLANKSTPSHTVLTLYQSLVVHNVVKFQAPSLYSLHAYPIHKRPTTPSHASEQYRMSGVDISTAESFSQNQVRSVGNLYGLNSDNESVSNQSSGLNSAHEDNADIGLAMSPPDQPLSPIELAMRDARTHATNGDGSGSPKHLSMSLPSVSPIRTLNISTIPTGGLSTPTPVQRSDSEDSANHRMMSVSLQDDNHISHSALLNATDGDNSRSGRLSHSDKHVSGRSFFGFSAGKSKSKADLTGSSNNLSGRLQSITRQQSRNVQQSVQTPRPIAMIAILVSKLKDLTPVTQPQTNRSSGMFRRNTENNDDSFGGSTSIGAKSGYGRNSLVDALMTERMSDV